MEAIATAPHTSIILVCGFGSIDQDALYEIATKNVTLIDQDVILPWCQENQIDFWQFNASIYFIELPEETKRLLFKMRWL